MEYSYAYHRSKSDLEAEQNSFQDCSLIILLNYNSKPQKNSYKQTKAYSLDFCYQFNFWLCYIAQNISLLNQNYKMIKASQKGKRIHMSRLKSQFSIRSLVEQNFSSPQLFLQITSITPTQTSIPKSIKILLEEEINALLDQVTRIISQHQVNLREAMNYVRSSILFKQIDEINANIVNEIVGEFAKNKIEDLEAALQLKSRELSQLKKERKQEHDFNEERLKVNKVSKIEPLKDHNQSELISLYNKAKLSTFHEFLELYKKLEGSNRLQFIQISNLTPKSKRLSAKHFDIKQQKKNRLMRVLSPLLNNLSETQRSDLLEILKEQLTHECPNPCCRWTENAPQSRNRMTATNFGRKQAKANSFYISDKVNKYYKRYYHSTFEIDKIRNVTKTEAEQMQKLYKVHKTKDKFLQKKRNFRCQSSV